MKTLKALFCKKLSKSFLEFYQIFYFIIVIKSNWSVNLGQGHELRNLTQFFF